MLTRIYFDKKRQPIVDKPLEPVRNVSSCFVYYCFYGRNAWHSTWVQRYYYDGCMHERLDLAKQYAESIRKQGSIFNIVQLPAIKIETAHEVYLVCQINTSTPFLEYSLENVLEDHPDINNHPIKYGLPINNLLQNFLHDSEYWDTIQEPVDSIIHLMCKDKHYSLASFNDDESPHGWVSKSIGSHFLLSWHEDANLSVSSHYIRNFCAIFDRENLIFNLKKNESDINVYLFIKYDYITTYRLMRRKTHEIFFDRVILDRFRDTAISSDIIAMSITNELLPAMVLTISEVNGGCNIEIHIRGNREPNRKKVALYQDIIERTNLKKSSDKADDKTCK